MNSVLQDVFNRLQHLSDQNLLDIETAKRQGRKVIGFYCLYSPMEIVLAADAIALPLCGTRHDPIAAAEEILPRNLCPLIKSSFGFAMTDTCPFFRFSDMLVGDTTCDGKKKMFELLRPYKPLYVLQLPQNQNPLSALPFWLGELARFRDYIGNFTGKDISDDRLRAAIRLLNRERQARKALLDLGKLKPAPVSGTDLLSLLFKIGFLAHKEKGITWMNEIVEMLLDMARQGRSPFAESTPRVLLTGVPVGIGSDKVIHILEAAGASVVCFENCSGYKQAFTVDEDQAPLEALAEQYLRTPCSVMSPNTGRMDLLRQLATEFTVDGIVDLTWQACHTYNVESFLVGKMTADELSLPFLHIETDYSSADTEQLRVRIQAFLEMI